MTSFQSQDDRDSVEQFNLGDTLELRVANLGHLRKSLNQLLVESKVEEVICESYHVKTFVKFLTIVLEHVFNT